MSNIRPIADRIKNSIDEWCKTEFKDEFREHLGASVIGRACDREIWYSWRWFVKPTFKRIDRETGEVLDIEAPMRRLFQRGHAEEDRFVAYLRGIGCEVHDYHPTNKKKDGSPDQFKISDVDGHFGGSLDALVKIPPHLTGFTEPVWAVGEFKTYGVSAWKWLKKHGGLGDDVKIEHLRQFSTYAMKYALNYALYLAICKNDDDLHVEFHKVDPTIGHKMLIRANNLVKSKRPPLRISQDPASFKCKFCDSKQVCHFGAAPERNCRTCVYSQPFTNKKWVCNKWGDNEILLELMQKGCDSYTPIQST